MCTVRAILVVTLLLIFHAEVGAETEREAIINHTQRATWVYYTDDTSFANVSTNSRWYISPIILGVRTDAYSLGPISNGKAAWWTVGTGVATLDSRVFNVSVAQNLDSDPSDTFWDVGQQLFVTNPIIHSDRRRLQGKTHPIEWYFFQAPNGLWYIVNAPGYGASLSVLRFAGRDGQYVWPPVDVSGFTYTASPNPNDNSLTITFASEGSQGPLHLKWPLSTPKPATPSAGGAFGDPWGNGITKCAGLPMTHTGVDIPNTVGNPVYAAEAGFVEEILPASQTGGFASAIVLEHDHPAGGKYTTSYWHVTPLPGVVVAPTGSPPTFIPRGTQIATVANIANGSHLHFGVRIGPYSDTYSDKGALPTGSCSDLVTFPEHFIDPWNVSQVVFQ